MGRDKATLAIAGSSLVERVISVVAQRCNPVFVVAATGQTLPGVAARVLRDDAPGLGPLPATGRGLRAAAQAGAQRAFVCAVDMPLLTVELINTLAGPAARLDVDAVLPWDGRDHYLAGVYRTALAERIDALVETGERRMGALIAQLDTQRIVVADPRPLTNLNTPADLDVLTAILNPGIE